MLKVVPNEEVIKLRPNPWRHLLEAMKRLEEQVTLASFYTKQSAEAASDCANQTMKCAHHVKAITKKETDEQSKNYHYLGLE